MGPEVGAGTFFGKASHRELMSCEPVLRIWAHRLLAHPDLPCDIAAHEGHRGKQRQNRLADRGLSRVRWPHGRHNAHPSRALDVVPIVNGRRAWDRELLKVIGPIGLSVWQGMVEEGLAHGRMTWGGDWDRDGDTEDERFFDGAHFEIEVRP